MTRKRPLYCDDWQCPDKWRCAHHLCRSEEYWAMSDKPLDFFRGDRRAWGCVNFRKDVYKPWLTAALTANSGVSPPKIPSGYKGPRIVR